MCQKCGVGKGDVVSSHIRGLRLRRDYQCSACGHIWVEIKSSNPRDTVIEMTYQKIAGRIEAVGFERVDG